MSAASCTLTPEGTVTNVSVHQKTIVRYKFKEIGSGLALRYAVAVNGAVLAEFSNTPGIIPGDHTITVNVDSGSKVALYLNSDAYPRFRQHPVYDVVAGQEDVLVEIEQKQGCKPAIQATVGEPTCEAQPKRKSIRKYRATLTGDIWMKISHRYSQQEAESCLPKDLCPAIRQAILRIFCDEGLPYRSFEIDFPANAQTPASRLLVKLDDKIDKNAQQNIGNCPLQKEVLPRTHPMAYAVLFTEAYATGVIELSISSTWRPMLGAIVHRMGLGLDVTYLRTANRTLRLDRTSLKTGGKATENICQEERDKYAAFNEKIIEKAALERNIRDTQKDYNKYKNKDPAKASSLTTEMQDLNNQLTDVKAEVKKRRPPWEMEVKAHEPQLLHDFREKLENNPHVTQILDPWYIEMDTRNDVPPSANAQVNDVESGHNDHLHITLNERHLL